MATKTIGIILNGATGRICSTQHLANALIPIRDEGGLPVGDDRVLPRLLLAGRDAERLAAVARTHGVRAVDHRPRRRAGRPGLRDLLRRRRHPSARRGARQGDRRRQARLCREAGGADRGRRARLAAGGAGARAQARRGRGQGPSAGPAEARRAHEERRARPHRRLPARIRLVGVRRHRAAVAAAELELPRRRRRRADPRHVSALALRDREHRRPHRRGSPRPRGPPRPSAPTSAARASRSTSRTAPRPWSSSRTAPSARS